MVTLKRKGDYKLQLQLCERFFVHFGTLAAVVLAAESLLLVKEESSFQNTSLLAQATYGTYTVEDAPFALTDHLGIELSSRMI